MGRGGFLQEKGRGFVQKTALRAERGGEGLRASWRRASYKLGEGFAQGGRLCAEGEGGLGRASCNLGEGFAQEKALCAEGGGFVQDQVMLGGE
eukprot:354266-Chlamydomonas_euryale.AAC.2